MDFFAAGNQAAHPNLDNTDDFAKAIQQRFGSSSTPLLSSLNHHPPTLSLSSRKDSTSLPPDSFKYLNPQDLSNIDALIIDIRPHAAYSSARIPNALSLSVPSTLLKRPMFSLDRLAAMLPSPSARQRFTRWKQAQNIVVYDADSSGNPHLPEGSNILGLLRKFANDTSPYTGGIYWLKGGFQRVWREKRDMVDSRPLVEDDEKPTASVSLRPSTLPMSAFAGSKSGVSFSGAPTVSNKSMPSMAANPFFDAIRQNVELSQGITERIPLRLPKRVRKRLDDLPFDWLKSIAQRAAKRDDESSASPISEESFSSSSSEEEEPVDDMDILPPATTQLLTDHPPKPHSTLSEQEKSSSATGSSSDSSIPDPDPKLVDQGMENLAMQFYRIELAEQRRLMGIMHHHSQESEAENRKVLAQDKMDMDTTDLGFNMSMSGNPTPLHPLSNQPLTPREEREFFPYSITAGVEKGSKNRYRHIWPFEHARVRLHRRSSSPEPEEGDATMMVQDDKVPSLPLYQPKPQASFASASTTSLPASFSSGSPVKTHPRFADGLPPSGALTGPAYTPPPPSSASASRASTSSPSKQQFNLTLPTGRRMRTTSAGPSASSPLPKPKLINFPPSMVPIPSLSSSLPNSNPAMQHTPVSASYSHPPLSASFTTYRSGHASGSGGESAVDSTTESEWEDPKPLRSKKGKGKGKKKDEGYDDYVNASYVQPLCTNRKYIATQGPLDATVVDFWTLVYQQNVHVIVMLTREVEGSMIKCASYWTQETYGPYELKTISIEGKVEQGQSDTRKMDAGGFYFPDMTSEDEKKKKKDDKKVKRVRLKEKASSFKGVKAQPGSGRVKLKDITSTQSQKKKFSYELEDLPIIKRVFELKHTGFPDQPARRVVHLQYLDWPDMNVPNDPRGILGLIKQVDKAVEETVHWPQTAMGDEQPQQRDRKHDRKPSNESVDRTTGIAKHAIGRENVPVLLHCSAGVGRTGGFIAVDAVLDGLRRELRKARRGDEMKMDVDDDTSGELRKDSSGEDVVMTDGAESAGPVETRDDVVPIHGHAGETFHVAVHHDRPREMVGHGGPNPHVEIRTPMPLERQETTKGREMEDADTSTRMWSQTVSDQTGHYGNASRVNQTKIPLEPSSVEPISEISNSSASDESSYGFQSGFDKRFSGLKGALKHAVDPESSTTSLSASSAERRTWSAPTGERPVVNPKTEAFVIPSGAKPSRLGSTKWLLPESDRRAEKSPSPVLPSDSAAPSLPPSSRPISPGATSTHAEEGNSSGSGSLDSPVPVLKYSPPNSIDNNGSSGGSGPESSVPPSGSGSGSGSGVDSGSRSAVVSSGGSASVSSRSRSMSVADSSPMESGGVLPSAGQDTKGLRGFDKKLDKVASIAAAEKVADKAAKLKSTEAQRAAFDYTEPRPLHGQDSPKALSMYKEPLWEVVQDMREQRMSLCQSLRQYVFVHAVVIEGALMILDEENERDGIVRKRKKTKSSKSSKDKLAPLSSSPDLPKKTAPHARVHNRETDASSVTTTTSAKRQASPTELPQEDKKGGQLLHKKPSIKRKPDSDEKLATFEDDRKVGLRRPT